MERGSLNIEDMPCGHRVRPVSQALERLPGGHVEQVEVGAAVVARDPAAGKAERMEEARSEEVHEVRDSGRAP